MNRPLSVVFIANNASRHIGEVIGAARRVSDDIIVLDSGSEDNTPEIARDMGARVVFRDWLGYSATKNVGNSMAQHDMILSLDADEVFVSSTTREVLPVTRIDDRTIGTGKVGPITRAIHRAFRAIGGLPAILPGNRPNSTQ